MSWNKKKKKKLMRTNTPTHTYLLKKTSTYEDKYILTDIKSTQYLENPYVYIYTYIYMWVGGWLW